MNKKAIIDLGSLKMKVTIFDTITRKPISSYSHLTLLGKGLNDTKELSSESLTKLKDALKKTADLLYIEHITEMVIIGTEALRQAKNVDKVHTLIKKYLPGHSLDVVDQQKEAELFFKAVSREFPKQEIIAMDIGGGSVQVVKGSYDPETKSVTIMSKHSLPTGTYYLQQQYSPNNSVISDKIDDAYRYIKRTYAKVNSNASILVFGSTCMLDFIQASGISTSTEEQNKVHPISVSQKRLAAFLEKLKQLAPDQRMHYYPEGEYFMYGADYLLMNVLQAIARTGAVKIYPTNLASAYAFI